MLKGVFTLNVVVNFDYFPKEEGWALETSSRLYYTTWLGKIDI